ncbi:MAG: response regulator transcription factor [Chloroflexi bacterium]|nr:response regulator transcription factor [Chloroflexota bacterium]
MTETIKLLIVDDHPVVCSGLRAIFEHTFVAVIAEAGSGREAIDLAVKVDPDVVLMDVRMPDMDGFDITKAITNGHDRPRVLILTCFESDDYLRRAVHSGASGYLLKSLHRDELLGSVRAVWKGQTIFDTAKMANLIRSLDGSGRTGNGIESITSLSEREVTVLRLVAVGRTNAEIADELSFSVGTIKKIMQEIISKLGVADRTQAAVIAVKQGLEL